MNYKTTRRCDRDLIEIYVSGAALFGVDRAERYHQGLVAIFELLAKHPEIARQHTEINPPVRLHPDGAHMIAYTAQSDDISIVRVLHGRQDWERHLSS